MAKNSRHLWAEKIAKLEKGEKLSSSKKISLSDFARSKTFTRVAFTGTVLGIDPSLRGTGLAVVRFRSGKSPELLDSMLVKNHPKLTQAECLCNIFRYVDKLSQKYEADCAAVEQTIFVQNNQTALILGAARGAAIAAAANFEIPVFEYPPLRIKQAVVGFGRASKEQIIKTVASILQISPLTSDESDAAAAALTHIFTYKDLI